MISNIINIMCLPVAMVAIPPRVSVEVLLVVFLRWIELRGVVDGRGDVFASISSDFTSVDKLLYFILHTVGNFSLHVCKNSQYSQLVQTMQTPP